MFFETWVLMWNPETTTHCSLRVCGLCHPEDTTSGSSELICKVGFPQWRDIHFMVQVMLRLVGLSMCCNDSSIEHGVTQSGFKAESCLSLVMCSVKFMSFNFICIMSVIILTHWVFEGVTEIPFVKVPATLILSVCGQCEFHPFL